MLITLALLIGVIAGLRAMTAPAAVAWAAWAGWFNISNSFLAFMGYHWTQWIFTVAALGELVTDQLPTTPSRKVPIQFGTRIVMGALTGGAIGASGDALVAGAIAGIVGAVIGTYGGAFVRGKMAVALGNDHPAAFIEDAIAIIGAFLIVSAV
ncbi:DUF4126 domain-containing protein [Agrobacterium tumefaciens]|uniref:DUF4126 domain-containing protein n=1 Tax=Agrobacterium tumefaciens TaxID=358 RepID=UPI00287D9C9E|nr:DUF4126 domain-containing protein [Agrobacterium tumefaciens]MDS7595468.1 DUF4126 domain-containing protein [Agrobacterium tumefaciens]